MTERIQTRKAFISMLKPLIDIDQCLAGFIVETANRSSPDMHQVDLVRVVVGGQQLQQWMISLWSVIVPSSEDDDIDETHVSHLLDEWVTREFPQFIKLGHNYHHPQESLIVHEMDDEVSRHPVAGTLFRVHCQETPLPGGGVLIADYECLDQQLDVLREIRRVVVDKGESEVFYYALVRRYTPSGFKYYPLPLVFASAIERRIAARETGKPQPAEQWVQRRRRAVQRLLDGLSKEK